MPNKPLDKGFDTWDKEKLRENAREAGKKSREAQALNATFRAALVWALDLPAVQGKATVERLRRRYPDLTNRDAIAIAMTAQAIQKQDVKAFLALRDTMGEAPEQNVSVKSDPLVIRIETVDSSIDNEEED